MGVLVDTTAPYVPDLDLNSASDTGFSDTDNITSNKTPAFSGYAETGSTVKLYDGTAQIGSTTAVGGTWSITLSGELSAGIHSITAKSFDAAGNESAASTALSVNIDATSPSVPVITGISDDTGSSASDYITKDSTLTFSGAAEVGSTVTVYINNGLRGTATADASGYWSYVDTIAPLLDGTYALKIKATDEAGNESGYSTSSALTINTAAPTVDGVADGQTYTAAVSPTFANATAELKKGTSAAISYTSGTEINVNGSYLLTVTDTAGNVTAVSFTVALPSAPEAPQNVVFTPENGSVTIAFSAPSDNGGSAVTGYIVKYGTEQLTINDSSATSYTLTGLTNASQYGISIAAKNSIGTGAFSAEEFVLVGRTGKTITAASIGTLSGGNLTGVPSATTVAALKAGLTVSAGASAEIISATGGGAVADQNTTTVTTAMKVLVTAENGASAEYSIAFELPKYTAVFNSNGGTTVASVSNIALGVTISAPTAPTKADFIFAGWYKESALMNVWSFASDTVTVDMTLFAKWTAAPVVIVTTTPQTTPAVTTTTEQQTETTAAQETTTPQTTSPAEQTTETTPAPEKEIIIKEAPASIENPELIKVEAVGNAFTDSVEVRLKDDPETKQIIEDTLSEELGGVDDSITVFPLDISLYIKGTDTRVQPSEGTSVKITCPIPLELLGDKDSIKVVCVIDGKAQVLETVIVEIDGVFCAQFYASHFSPYAMVVDKANVLDEINDSPENDNDENPSTGFRFPIGALAAALVSGGAAIKLKKRRSN